MSGQIYFKNPINLFAVIVAIVSLTACDDGNEAAAPSEAPPPSVTVATAFSKEIRASAEFVGKVEAIDNVDLIARVSGYLHKKGVADGAVVDEGQLLFAIERDQYTAAQASAKAELAKALADQKLKEADLARDDNLFKKGHISKAKFEASLAARDQASANVSAAEASVAQTDLQLTYTEIKAPFAGRIGRTRFSVGDVVGPNTGALASLIRVAPIYVLFSISEKDFVQAMERVEGSLRDFLASGNAPNLGARLPTGQELKETGKIVFVDNRVDPATGTIAVRGQFENKRELLVPGQFVTIIIESAKAQRTLLVPQAAIQRDQKGTFVLTVNDQQLVEQRHIETGDQIETAWVVKDGLQEGERVIVQGLQKVRPGVPVNAVVDGEPVGN